MNSDDLAKSFARTSCRQMTKSPTGSEKNTKHENQIYPGLDSSDEETGDELQPSFDINFAQEGPFFRFRTNTDAKLDKMSDIRRRQQQIKVVKCDDSIVKFNAEISDDELFVRKDFAKQSVEPMKSKLSYQIDHLPPMPVNRFRKYSCFDGTSYPINEIRTIQVFVMPFPNSQRNYPVRCCVQASAKIEEFIGFILFKCTQDFPEASQQANFEEVKDYGLFITDESGEPDLDFPALDFDEQVQRFQFAYLALSKRTISNVQQRALSVVSDNFNSTMIYPINRQSPIESLKSFPTNARRTDEIAMNVHDTMIEAPIYRAFRVFLISKKHFRTEVQIGISGEKVEIDPLSQKNAIIFKSVKAIHYSMNSVAWCEISTRKSSRFEFKIAHDPLYFDPLSFGASTSFNESTQPSIGLKIHTFECDPTTAEEIVLKVNNILKSVNSSIYRDFPNRKDSTKKSFIRKKK